MKLSTRLAHAKVRLKHQFVKLRIQKPVYYQSLAVLVLVFGVLGLVAAYFLFVDKKVTNDDTSAIEIKTYSLNGEVSNIVGNVIGVKISVLKTENGSSVVSYDQKNLILNQDTLVLKTTIENGKVSYSNATLSDIKQGQTIAIYTPNDPTKLTDLQAEKIEILANK